MVKSVDRALTIISLVSEHKQGLGVTDVAAKLSLTKSSAYKLLATLVEHGFIEQDEETKKYRLGYRYLELSATLLESIDIRRQARPFLEQLEATTNEVVHLVLYDQGEMVYIDKLEGTKTLRTHSKIGRRAPIHCTSVGKVIMAYLPEKVQISLIERYGLPPHTERTITDKETFMKELEKIRLEGYGYEMEENEPGITCIAAPIFDYQGAITAAVSISGPSIRLSKERLHELRPLIIAIGKKISQRLGYQDI
ncbi:IclR family transcriptional regulator [Halalkalibacterium halodurans]|uniref:Glycerol operon regulatory protein n=1 Tax=Halalkalibacterium halodurans (strain ATCC BAA-125 / DSM 18197 / FERM 7344 / JCM 9153 / C-125) TaxID=272558 RepID=Q9KAZ9_HALH5|nr:IclR family transcriptional regulator [Halalkalibacterium halodurans]MED4081112.1 IclR family transcriptional regulator [Halalkalibacterium halodurans]MED4085723.1 IclR family transcriptional regulator [Halalkalibacterium halodurans]MED4106462.1 IclR family transcriptional regulator [Halalkalibacterium halodurans]MED4108240.1 IclR family transcriptional regulator [Halalkalibacterium halodurans]MED4151140.1 IclR family transcriptional regulator [Halalkalibacterium halodurans]